MSLKRFITMRDSVLNWGDVGWLTKNTEDISYAVKVEYTVFLIVGLFTDFLNFFVEFLHL